MIGEAKSFASLSAGLLARKGGARPAMRRQMPAAMGLGMQAGQAGPADDLGWNDMGYDVDPDPSRAAATLDIKPMLSASVMHAAEEAPNDEDLRGEAPVPEVVRQQAELVERLAHSPVVQPDAQPMMKPADGDAGHAAKAKPKAVRSKKSAQKALLDSPATKVRARDKAAFTLRLDPQQHLRLRLASAVSNRSSQMILIGLLDEYLASLPEIGDLASRVPAVSAARITRSR